LTDLGIEGESRAGGINNNGQVVGEMRDGRSFLREEDGTVAYIPEEPEGITRAYAVNNRGWIAGSSDLYDGPGGPLRAFAWYGGSMRILPSLAGGEDLPSNAGDINDRGQIVGWGTIATGMRAVLWDRREANDLGSLPGGSGVSIANGVNDSTKVVGASDVGGTDNHAFV